MTPSEPRPKNPKRIAAGKRNHALRKGLTDAGRQRLRETALRHKPWKHSTGPKTPEGKAQVIENGKKRQLGPRSVREIQADMAGLRDLLEDMRATRSEVSQGCVPGQ